MQLDDVTVVLPTRNEADNIVGFLASLPTALNLIVVDASDDDATIQHIHVLRHANTRVVQQPSNVTQARQIGADLARTPWLLFTDADVTFAPNYFATLATLPDEARVGAWYGIKSSQQDYLGYYRWFMRGQLLFAGLGVPTATGSNLLVSRKALAAAGGFDLRLTCNEDSELAWRLKRAHYSVNFARELVVFAHDHRRLQRGVAKKVLHSAVRCALLYLNLMPSRWREHDWGYWQPSATTAQHHYSAQTTRQR